MKKKYNIAIIGATGLVGQEILRILSKRNFPVQDLYLSASGNSFGEQLSFNNKVYNIISVDDIPAKEVDFIFNAAPFNSGAYIADHFKYPKNIILDKSGFFRNTHPLIVHGINERSINLHEIAKQNKSTILSMPNCCVVFLASVLYPIISYLSIKRVVIATYQSISGAGRGYLENFIHESASILSNNVGKQNFCAFNVISHIGEIDNQTGFSSEEGKIMSELKHILKIDCPNSVTAIRVPVLIGHCAAINIEFDIDVDIEKLKLIINNSNNCKVVDNSEISKLSPRSVAGSDEVFVGRIRKNTYSKSQKGYKSNIVDLWAASDNLRIGAALNSVKIAEYIITQTIVK